MSSGKANQTIDPFNFDTLFRYEDNISSGPQSKILEGLTWEEAEKLKESLIKGGAAPGAHEVIMMGAASKGIIKREQQHNATVYKTYYQVW